VFDPRRKICALHNKRFAGDELHSCLTREIYSRRLRRLLTFVIT
jgi:hypothetical protein